MKKQVPKQKNNWIFLLLANLGILFAVLFAFYKLGENEILVVDSIAVNIRSGPGLAYDIQGQVTRGTELQVVEKQNDWYKVSVDGKDTGWIASWLVSQKATSVNTNLTAKVNTDGTKLRKENNTDSDILEELSKGTVVTVSSEKDGWSKVTYNKQTGWVNSDLLEITDQSEKTDSNNSEIVYAIQNGTNIRKTADVDGELVTQVDLGAELTILSTEGEWYKVKTADNQTGYVANWVVTFVKSEEKEAASQIAEATIMIDPGHGGDDPGAEAMNGTYEKTITLSTAKLLKKELEAMGANVILTRTDDSSVDLAERPALSNQYQVDAFISLHYDSTEDINVASGTTTYYYHDNAKTLAKDVNKYLKSDLPLDNRGYETEDYQVLRDNDQPAILLELGYLSSSTDSNYAVKKSYQTKAAKAIAKGLQAYFQGIK